MDTSQKLEYALVAVGIVTAIFVLGMAFGRCDRCGKPPKARHDCNDCPVRFKIDRGSIRE